MAAAFVQRTTATTGATFPATLTTTAFTGSVVTGNAILVALLVDGLAASTAFTVTDTKSNTYTRLSTNYQLNIDQLDVWIATNVVGGAAITITAGNLGGTTAAIIVEEWSGLATASALDKQISNNSTGGPTAAMSTGTTATTTNANDLIWLAFAGASATVTSSVATGFSNASLKVSSPSTLFVQSKTVSATGTQSAATTLSAAVSWEGCIVAVKNTATTSTAHNLTLLGIGS